MANDRAAIQHRLGAPPAAAPSNDANLRETHEKSCNPLHRPATATAVQPQTAPTLHPGVAGLGYAEAELGETEWRREERSARGSNLPPHPVSEGYRPKAGRWRGRHRSHRGREHTPTSCTADPGLPGQSYGRG